MAYIVAEPSNAEPEQPDKPGLEIKTRTKTIEMKGWTRMLRSTSSKKQQSPSSEQKEVRRCAKDVSVQRSSQHRDWSDTHAPHGEKKEAYLKSPELDKKGGTRFLLRKK
jgi:hypothetical protein